MSVTARASAQRQALLDEYRVALRLWSETKALYSEDSAEFAQAAGSLTKLEHDLMRWEVQALATTL